MNGEDQLNELHRAIEAAEGTLPRLAALSAFFAACQQELSTRNSSQCYHVFAEAAFLLGARLADGVVWDWWQEQARAATAPRHQEQLRIALFELVPAYPVIWSDFYRLWDFWFDPAARWAVFASYWWFPRRLPTHLARYIAHRRRHKLPVPEFSHEEFQVWLQNAKAA